MTSTRRARPIHSLFTDSDVVPSIVLVKMVLFTLVSDLLGSSPSTTRNLGNVFLGMVVDRVSGSASGDSVLFGVEGEHEGDFKFCPDMLILVGLLVVFNSLHTKTRVPKACDW